MTACAGPGLFGVAVSVVRGRGCAGVPLPAARFRIGSDCGAASVADSVASPVSGTSSLGAGIGSSCIFVLSTETTSGLGEGGPVRALFPAPVFSA